MSSRKPSAMSDAAAEQIVGGTTQTTDVNNAPCDHCSCTRMFGGCICDGHTHVHTVPPPPPDDA